MSAANWPQQSIFRRFLGKYPDIYRRNRQKPSSLGPIFASTPSTAQAPSPDPRNANGPKKSSFKRRYRKSLTTTPRRRASVALLKQHRPAALHFAFVNAAVAVRWTNARSALYLRPRQLPNCFTVCVKAVTRSGWTTAKAVGGRLQSANKMPNSAIPLPLALLLRTIRISIKLRACILSSYRLINSAGFSTC